MASGGHTYARGDNAVAHCERCGFKYNRKELLYDGQYRDLLVCGDCWDPKHPQDYLPAMSDPISIRDPRSDQDSATNYTAVKWPPVPEFPGLLNSGSYDAGGGEIRLQRAYPLGIEFTLNAFKYLNVDLTY